ncbi:16950_t:CDS:10 [Dentiscutata heterogama]|uniref:16950_t:CDS:1 n=1 Tax=Dentiscutata heterogama TaxID=1316150 RepID=A0ACA9KIM9_9GLOM|nr:16950_t:CDS:10 [Dentiscutata heterogama]
MEMFQFPSKNKDKKFINTFLRQCLERTELEQEKILNELSKCLCDSPNDYLPLLETLVSCLHSRNPQHLNFVSLLILIVIVPNLQYHSDILSFGVLLSRCIELLWNTQDIPLVISTTKRLFSAIVDINGVLGVLISELPGNRCLKRILFSHKIINRIERDELLKAVETIEVLIDKCSEHDCSSLIEILKDRKSTEQQKKDSFRDLIESLQCLKCHKNALINFCPDKYSLPPEEEMNIKAPNRLFKLPFEFDDNDRLGPWDVLLSENAIKDIQKLESNMVNAVMNKLGQISSGKWNKYGFHCINDHNIPVYIVEVRNNVMSLKILWQVDYGFSIRIYKFTQLVKSTVTNVYTDKLVKTGSNLPMSFEGKETTKSSEYGLRDPQLDDEKLIEIHKMLVTNKFTPISKKFFRSLANGGSDFTFQVSKIEYEFINHPTSAIVIGRSGTGKTTSIVFRLVASYMANKKRQIFITVSDNLCRLLIKQQKFDTDSEEEFCYSSNSSNTFDPHLVDYRVFTMKYWPHLGDLYKQKLDCELGTDPEIDYLSREEYRNISIKRYPTFCHNRDKVYDLFLRYNEMKSRNGDYDSTDRTLYILQINEVYIDECQDNQIVDIALILKLFDNANGIFLAGDVAQCIARGSSFRFQSVRSLMYTCELDRFERSLTNYNRRDTINLKQFELNINYRSHNQILQLTSSVIDLIWYFFPDSIDKLSYERSEVGGPKPVVFSEVQAKDLFDTFYVDKQGEHVANHIEFGARQIIIVREAGIVETVFNCKGIEFDDVLIYNFFTNSPACEKWRVIHSALDKDKIGIPIFSYEKHCILCSEHKQLYVAVTRGRRSVWIFDENTKYSDSMCAYWEQKELIRISKDAKEITLFAKESSPQEWDEEGKEFLDKKNFKQASFCFKKSENKKLRDLSDAYHLQQIARDSVNFSDNATKKKNYTRAAQAFKTCSETFLEASCYEEGEIYEEAIDIYIKLENMIMLHVAITRTIIWRKRKNEEMCKRILLIFETQNKRDKLIIEYAREEEIKEAKELRSRGKFEEAANMFINTIKSYDNVTESLQCLLYLCRICALNVINDSVNYNAFEELNRFHKKAVNIINKAKSHQDTSEKPQQWDSLIEELQLYEAYLNNNVNQVYEYIIRFRNRGDAITEFRAITIWLKISQQEIYEKYQYRLECLLRLYEISILFMVLYDRVGKNLKDFENIFAVNAGNADNNLDKYLAF